MCGTRHIQRPDGAAPRLDGGIPGGPVGVLLEIDLGLTDKILRCAKFLWRAFGGARSLCGSHGLPRIAHLLHGRSGAACHAQQPDRDSFSHVTS